MFIIYHYYHYHYFFIVLIIMILIFIIIIIIIIIITIIIVAASPLPPTHHIRLRSGDRVRGLELRGLEVTNVWRIVTVGFSNWAAPSYLGLRF